MVRSHELRAQSHKTAPTSGDYLKSSWFPALCPAGYKLEVPPTPSLGLINLLQKLIKLRKKNIFAGLLLKDI